MGGGARERMAGGDAALLASPHTPIPPYLLPSPKVAISPGHMLT